jgi:hypothetical protein
MEEDELDDEDLEAMKEMDKDHEASDEAEIQDLSQEIDKDMRFFVATGEQKLGEAVRFVIWHVTQDHGKLLIEQA